MKQTELQKAYSPVPQGFHAALLEGLAQTREERPVQRRPLRLLLAVALALLLCGTALAVLSYYSVRDYQADGRPSADFEKSIVDIGRTYENDWITLTIGDAVFDGRSVALTMDLHHREGQVPVFLYPRLVGYCNGRRLDMDVEGVRGLDPSGFLYPNLLQGDVLEHHYGMDAAPYQDTAEDSVTWTFTMQVLTPNWPVSDQSALPAPGGPSLSIEEAQKPFLRAYQNRQILSSWGESLVEYDAILPPPEGMTSDAWMRLSLPERLAASGAFTLADTLECTFVTALPKVQTLGSLRYPLPEYTVELETLSRSFHSLTYRLERVYPSAMGLPPAGRCVHYRPFLLHR